MSTVRISDIVVPEIFAADYLKETMVKAKVFASGLVANDPLMSQLASANKGGTFQVPFYKDLADDESNVSSDDPAVSTTSKIITTGLDQAIKHFRNQSWSTMDLTASLASSDPMGRIKTQVSGYWARQYNKATINTLMGILASNVANNGGDMVKCVATDAAGAPVAGELISGSVILDAKQTMGDAADTLKVLMVHSVVHTALQKANLIAYLPGDSANIGFGTYLGYSLLVDDTLPAVAGAHRVTYTSVLAAPGVLKFGNGSPAVPVEVYRQPLAGNGGGQETLITRNEFALHPAGIKWTGASVAAQSPTFAELTAAANWQRVYAERKQIGLAFLQTNG